MSTKNESSDPLPFIKLDRTVKAKAPLLAACIGVPSPHALGSIIYFWDLCADPRELQKIIEQTPAGQDPEVVLTADEIRAKFMIASGGKEVDPDQLAAIGFLQKLDEKNYRVRGMSRFFDPVMKRISAKTKASTAGKASAEARAIKFGSAQPLKTGLFGPSSSASSNDVRTKFDVSSAVVRTKLELSSNEARTNAELARTLEDRGQSTDVLKDGSNAFALTSQAELVKTKPKRKPPNPEVEFARWVGSQTPDEKTVFETYESSTGLTLGADWGLLKYVRGKLKAHTADEICKAIRGHASNPWNREKQNLSLRSMLSDATKIAINATRAS